MYPNVVLLALCQAMLMTGTSLVLSTSSLVGASLAPSPALATLPLSLQYLTTMLVMFPVSGLMQKLGRRPVFVGGALIGAIGVTAASVGIQAGSFTVFALASLFVGTHNAIGQFYRFAAAEAVGKELRSRAISLTLAGGVLAAFLGPTLARLTRDVLEPPFAASFLALTGTTLLAALLATRLRLPPARVEATAGEARPLAVIAGQPAFVVAVLAAMLAYGTMNLLMTSTPLAMDAHRHRFADVATVIQWHVVCMYAPSFVTGDLIRRLGVLRVMAAGCGLMLVCLGINFAGSTVIHFQTALSLLGLGWNFLYVGGTTLLTETYRPAERARAQALNDTLVFTTVACSSLAGAGLVSSFGWQATNLAALPGIVIMLGGISWLGWRRSAPARA